MVLESVLQGFLQKQFGKYLENFDKQQINVGVSFTTCITCNFILLLHTM